MIMKMDLKRLSVKTRMRIVIFTILLVWTISLAGSLIFVFSYAKKNPQFVSLILFCLWIIGSITMGGVIIYTKKFHKKFETTFRALQASEMQLFKNAPVAIFIINRKGEYIDVNPAACKLVGYAREELLKFKVSNLRPPDSIAEGEKVFKTMLENGYSKAELFLLRKDGSRVFVSLNSMEMPDHNYIGYCADMTWKNSTDEAIIQAKEYAENIIQTANTLVVILDIQGNVKAFNKSAEEVTGYSLSEVIHCNWFEIIVPKDKYPGVRLAFNKLRNDLLPKNFENPILTKNGEERYIIWQNNAIREKGNVTGTISFGIDITERKNAEEALKESETLLSTIFNNVPLLMLLVDENGNVLKMNQTGLNMVHKNQDEVIGLSGGIVLNCVNTLQDPGGCGYGTNCKTCTIRNTVTRTLETGKSYSKVEGKLDTTNKKVNNRNILISTEFIKIIGRSCVLVTIEDITERKQAEAELQKHRERLEELVEERTKELQKEIDARKNTEEKLKERADDLEKFNKGMVNRELRITEMKQEINKLCSELGKPPAYEEFWHEIH